jgi:aerobic C4-dicarboxylate transport protein
VATVVVAVWEKDIDRARAKRVLDQDAEYRFVPAAPEPAHGHGHENAHAM